MPIDNTAPSVKAADTELSWHMQGRFVPELLAALLLALSLLLTYALWQNAQLSARQNLQAEFDFRVREIATLIAQRMAAYEQVLRGTKGFLLGAQQVDQATFRTYVQALRLEEQYPGIQGVGFSEIVPKEQVEQHVARMRRNGYPEYAITPPGDRSLYTAITLIEPFDAMNRRAFGYDMFNEPVRRAAMAHARDSNGAALSGKVTLIQEGSTDIQPGFLMYLPLYAHGLPIETLEQRRAALVGWVYAPFRMNDFMAGLGGERSADLNVAVYDGAAAEKNCLFGCGQSAASVPLLKTSTELGIAGRSWVMTVNSTPSLEARNSSEKPRLIAMTGIGAGLLLAALVWMLASGRRRAMTLALNMTRELRESHQKTAAEQKRMKVILENSHDAFVAVDAQGRVTDWNAQAERMFGWPASSAIGRDMAGMIIPQHSRDAHHAAFNRFTSTDDYSAVSRRIETEALHRSGTLIPVELSIAGIRTDAGPTIGAFIRDLSERKQAQQREAERQRVIEKARIALQNSQKLEAIGKLTGGVAHDFNNVLQIIAGNIQLMLHMGDAADREKRLHSVLQAVERGSRLSAQLLAYARRQPLQPIVVNVYRLLSNMDELLRRALGETIEVKVVAPQDLWNTQVDPNQLENVILNLAINARDAMDGAGTLIIELANSTLREGDLPSEPDVLPGSYVMLAFSDTGCGMAPDVIERAFEPFFTTKPEGEGTGLGLSMAYGFVHQSGGHIHIESTPGHGTTIRIYLPRSLEEEESIPVRPSEPVTGGSETILAVEDDAAVQATVVAMLEGLGYRVLKAGDAETALDILKSGEKIDLLFTDVVMPGPLTSPDLARQAKLTQPDIRVLFTSGYTRNAIMQGARLEPGVQLLSKPYRREDLARKIRQMLANRESEPQQDETMPDGHA